MSRIVPDGTELLKLSMSSISSRLQKGLGLKQIFNETTLQDCVGLLNPVFRLLGLSFPRQI